jgi:ribosomal-protein-alanine N-acetyltransferase
MEKLEIHTERLHIRNLKQEDINDFHIYRSNPEIALYQGFDVMSKEKAVEFIALQTDKLFGKPGEWVQYGIENKTKGKLIGDCAIKLDKLDPRIAEVGITISHLHQKNGFAKESMLGIMDFLFAVKKIHRMVETVDVENIASIRLIESIGFRKEGHFIENIFFNGKWGSEFQYAMLKSEWKQQ